MEGTMQSPSHCSVLLTVPNCLLALRSPKVARLKPQKFFALTYQTSILHLLHSKHFMEWIPRLYCLRVNVDIEMS